VYEKGKALEIGKKGRQFKNRSVILAGLDLEETFFGKGVAVVVISRYYFIFLSEEE
jgi:hypothetical protein